jgi:hypothetical protein
MTRAEPVLPAQARRGGHRARQAPLARGGASDPVHGDAILAKRNTGTRKEDARLVIALGPGFEAGRDCHLVIETNRGHDLGRIIVSGSAEPNTGVPGRDRGSHGRARPEGARRGNVRDEP